MRSRIRVLVTDDSAFMRHIIANTLLAEPDIQIVGMARDGLEAVAMAKKLRPDVVTLDVEMPRMDGIAALRKIMAEAPCRVVMLSSFTASGAETTLRALELGAVDFVPKPSGSRALDIHTVKDELLAKVRSAAEVPLSRLRAPLTPSSNALQAKKSSLPRRLSHHERVLVIGSSTGGPAALNRLIPSLPSALPAAVLVVQHMPAGFTRSMAERLDKVSQLSVKEAEPEDQLKAGQVLIAPGDYHMLVRNDERIEMDSGPRIHGVRPAVDVTMRSVARAFGRRSVGVILTGMGSDGRDGCAAIKAAGGRTLIEDESSCVVFGMPKSVLDAGLADRVSPLSTMADEIIVSLRQE